MAENSDIAEKELTASQLIEDLESEEKLEITIRRASNEIILRNPKDGKVVRLTGKFDSDEERGQLEDEGADEPPEPLTPAEFEEGIRRLNAIGFTFDVDLLPSVIAKDETSVDVNPEEFNAIRQELPQLPSEVGLVTHNTLTGSRIALDRLGGSKSFDEKSRIAQDLIIDDSYREQFFFRHALKLPSLEDIDWEISMRMHERGVKDAVNVPYAVLQLTFRDKNHRTSQRALRTYTVAANRDLIDKHLLTLTEARSALGEAFQLKTVTVDSKP